MIQLGERRWSDAAESFRRACPPEQVGLLAPQEQLRRNLALNFADLASHRPRVLQAIETAPSDPRFQIATTPSGRPTIDFVAPGTTPVRLSEGTDPLAYLAAVMEKLKPARQTGKPIAILGSGDGYPLVSLARHPIPLAFEAQQCVYLLEPNPANLMMVMLIHDLSGPNGPIQQPRFHWFVGRDCVAEFRGSMLADLYLPFPQVTLANAPDGTQLAGQLPQAMRDLVACDARLEQQLSRRYADLPVDRLIRATSPDRDRPPRALLVTTRFSTVLQHSTADTARALRELGWEVQVVIEPTAHHVLTFPAIRRSLLDFDPDVILQIDHVRSEYGSLFPGTLPFLSWTQDHLPNLTSADTGRSQGPLDFLLTNHGPWYSRNFAYPAENHIALGKLTQVPALPTSWNSDGPDLCYVSNASKQPEVAAREMVDSFRDYPELQELARACADQLIADYGEGRSYCGTVAMYELIARVAGTDARQNLRGIPELATELFERVNNLLYRQQALGWAVEVAEKRSLSLAIHGSGWDKLPRFAAYAKGPIAYGRALEELTRASKINLQIVPYFCLHQRLLDGLAAGGFYLVRSHPSDHTIARLAGFLLAHAPGARTRDEAARLIPPSHLAEFDRLAHDNAFIADRLDPVELVRVMQGQGLFLDGQSMPPRIDEVSFSGKAQLADRIDRFLPDADLRKSLALQQRSAVLGTLSYTSGMKRVMRELHELLSARFGRQEQSLNAA
ncbi:hypothetical protein [Cyanobium sp. Cruz-8H5]|uniref:glycosyltransferase family protein n=1 Tax=Cyanobium sp. Cruz-8H5 TaxID=2823712 RepID=UPI0020CDC21C|nr:hypothetical protein [Cyanobium sp. Cruz-8H5]MCP9861437.1 hypothetical protein [Cyanobium sp. Cruz-8H5]